MFLRNDHLYSYLILISVFSILGRVRGLLCERDMEELDLKTEPEENENEYYGGGVGDGGQQERGTEEYQDFTADDGVGDSTLNGNEGSGGGGPSENNESNGGNIVPKPEPVDDYVGHEEQEQSAYDDDGSIGLKRKGKDDDK